MQKVYKKVIIVLAWLGTQDSGELLIWYKERTIDVVLRIILEFMSMYQILGNGLMINLIDEGFILKIKTKKKLNKYVKQETKFPSLINI